MPIAFINNAASAIAGVANFPGPATLQAAFPTPNSVHNILVAWVTGNTGARPTNVTDTLGNVWYEIGQPINVGDNFSMWAVCGCLAGANTVSVNGMAVTVTGGPSLIIAEFGVSGCAPCEVAVQGFNPPRPNSGFATAFTKAFEQYLASQGPFFHMIVFGIYDNADGATGTVRTWSFTGTLPPASLQEGNIIDQIQEDGGTNTTALAYSLVPYPANYNECQFSWSPSIPALHGDETYPYWILLTSEA